MFDCQYDDEAYIYVRNDVDKLDLRPSNTLLYLFNELNQDIDHIYRVIEYNGETTMGYRIWRCLVDKALGDDMFDKLCQEMIDHGFDTADEEEPEPLDIEAWETFTGLRYENRPVISRLVEREMSNFDTEFKYYLSD